MLRDLILLVVMTAFLLFAVPGRALAYIDPGSGSYMLQLLLAGAVSALFALKVFWGKIKAFFKRGSEEEGEEIESLDPTAGHKDD